MAKPTIPLYYQGKTLGDMEQMLRERYLTKSGWLESAEEKLAICNGKPLPWFTYGAIEFLNRNISADLSVFEYGGGQSSLWWSKAVREIVTVEHNIDYFKYIKENTPGNAKLYLREENAPLTLARSQSWVENIPELPEPECNPKTMRSGQINSAFLAYALTPAESEQNYFDIIVVDGMARTLSTWAAIQHFQKNGFIIFDNSDRDFYKPAYDLLRNAGYRRIDFWGIGPINPYEWCTSIFYRAKDFTSVRWFDEYPVANKEGVFGVSSAPVLSNNVSSASKEKIVQDQNTPSVQSELSSIGSQKRQFDELGILVIGYNRPYHLQAVLESLRLQGRLDHCHVWIDGTQGRGEFSGANDKTIEIAQRYNVREVRTHWGHLGIEKLMLDSLSEMVQNYTKVLILEDDCFPVEGAVDAFNAELADIKNDETMYSVYGHHFGCEPEGTRNFPRFQGWGWAAHSEQIEKLLSHLQYLFKFSERKYISYAGSVMTPAVRARLDVTPGRNVIGVLEHGFSWDSASALTTARLEMQHRRTKERQVFNTGISKGVGHFQKDTERLRKPPLNMITLPEAWREYDRETKPCDFSKASYGLDALDLTIIEHLRIEPGFFVEIGGYDGVSQSNSVLLEKRGWKGLLIEANPGNFAKCCKSRPDMITEHAACVSKAYTEPYITMADVGLMSMTTNSAMSGPERETWLQRGEGFTKRPRQNIDVPATQISTLFDKHEISKIDLLLLDVEGAEIDVLEGLDFDRHAPAWIVAEDAKRDDVCDYLKSKGYDRKAILLERKYTRDCLYQKR